MSWIIKEKNDQLYSNKLEGYAFYKSVSDYTFAEPMFTLPPWCLTLTCLGIVLLPIYVLIYFYLNVLFLFNTS